MKNFINKGKSVEVVTPADGYTSGQAVKVGGLVGICHDNYVEGETAVIWIQGRYSVVKAVGAWSAGDRLFWDAGAKKFTTDSEGNTPAGFAADDAANDAATGDIILRQAGAGIAANVAVIATANASDLATAEALANANKTAINALITSLVDAGLMDAP
jgi:predicted RecA/RadA family phage recombinase